MRSIAVLGVAWAHVRTFGCDSVALRLPVVGIDVNQVLAGFGTGVDLFFVISGVCMYLMYAGRYPTFRWPDFRTFLVGRFRRIAPAFYIAAFAAFAAFLWVSATQPSIPWSTLLTHLTFTYVLVPHATLLASPFSSLSTEWEFYLLLPPLMIAIRRFGFWRTVIASAALSFLIGAVSSTTPVLVDLLRWQDQIPVRFIQFAFGIALARLHADGAKMPRFVLGPVGFSLGVVVMFVGRTLQAQWFLDHAGALVSLDVTLARTLVSLGYSIMIVSAIFSESVVSRTLMTRPFVLLGRWSYSFYLWHWFPSVLIGKWLVTHTALKGWAPSVGFILTLAVTTPIAALSYRWFEAPYFAKRAARTDAAVAATEHARAT